MVWLPYDAGLSAAAEALVGILKRLIVSPAVYTRAFLKSPSSRGLSELLVRSAITLLQSYDSVGDAYRDVRERGLVRRWRKCRLPAQLIGVGASLPPQLHWHSLCAAQSQSNCLVCSVVNGSTCLYYNSVTTAVNQLSGAAFISCTRTYPHNRLNGQLPRFSPLAWGLCNVSNEIVWYCWAYISRQDALFRCSNTVNPFIADQLRLYTLPYWCNRPVLISEFWHSGTLVLSRSVLSARVPECQIVNQNWWATPDVAERFRQ